MESSEATLINEIIATRRSLTQCLLTEHFEEADRLKEKLYQLERHFRSRGWKLPDQ